MAQQDQVDIKEVHELIGSKELMIHMQRKLMHELQIGVEEVKKELNLVLEENRKLKKEIELCTKQPQ